MNVNSFFRCVGNRAIENDAHTHLHTHTGRATNVLKVLMSSATVLTMECGMQNDYLCQMPNFNLITLSACVCVHIFSWTSKVQCTLNTRVTRIFFRWISKYSSDFFAICNWLKEKKFNATCAVHGFGKVADWKFVDFAIHALRVEFFSFDSFFPRFEIYCGKDSSRHRAQQFSGIECQRTKVK